MDIKAELRGFITSNFFVPAGGLKDDDLLIDTGVIDSTGVLEVIHFVEDTYGTKLHDDEILPENLGSIERLVAFVERKKREGDSPRTDAVFA
jgi:acyl carrier protein